MLIKKWSKYTSKPTNWLVRIFYFLCGKSHKSGSIITVLCNKKHYPVFIPRFFLRRRSIRSKHPKKLILEREGKTNMFFLMYDTREYDKGSNRADGYYLLSMKLSPNGDLTLVHENLYTMEQTAHLNLTYLKFYYIFRRVHDNLYLKKEVLIEPRRKGDNTS